MADATDIDRAVAEMHATVLLALLDLVDLARKQPRRVAVARAEELAATWVTAAREMVSAAAGVGEGAPDGERVLPQGQEGRAIAHRDEAPAPAFKQCPMSDQVSEEETNVRNDVRR